MFDVTVEYKRLGWNQANQWDKIGEELGEVVKAIVMNNPVEIIKESLDVMETLWTHANIIADDYGMDINIFIREHNEKLLKKGYIQDPYAGHLEVD